MRETRPDIVDPFRCYLGRRIALEAGSFVIVEHEVRDRDLYFVAREPATGAEVRLTVLELMSILDFADA